MRVTIFGSGYVGLGHGRLPCRSGQPRALRGCRCQEDRPAERGEVPIHEPGLDELVKRNAEAGRLDFTTDAAKGVAHGLFQFIAVGTPPDEDGSADLHYVLAVARTIGETHEPTTASSITKSTVPVGTADKVRKRSRHDALAKRGVELEFDVVSNPEFLKEGAAIDDFMKPDRVVIGTDNPRTHELLRALYEPFTRNHDRFIVMDVRSAELTKYAANAMLATKISFMNELANLAERAGRRHREGARGHRLRSAHRLQLHLSRLRLRRLVLPQGRAGADPLGARSRLRRRDPGGRRERSTTRQKERALRQDHAALRR